MCCGTRPSDWRGGGGAAPTARPGAGRAQAGHERHERGLARPVRAQEPEEFPRSYVERHAVQGRESPEALDDAVGGEEGRGHLGPGIGWRAALELKRRRQQNVTAQMLEACAPWAVGRAGYPTARFLTASHAESGIRGPRCRT